MGDFLQIFWRCTCHLWLMQVEVECEFDVFRFGRGTFHIVFVTAWCLLHRHRNIEAICAAQRCADDKRSNQELHAATEYSL